MIGGIQHRLAAAVGTLASGEERIEVGIRQRQQADAVLGPRLAGGAHVAVGIEPAEGLGQLALVEQHRDRLHRPLLGPRLTAHPAGQLHQGGGTGAHLRQFVDARGDGVGGATQVVDQFGRRRRVTALMLAQGELQGLGDLGDGIDTGHTGAAGEGVQRPNHRLVGHRLVRAGGGEIVLDDLQMFPALAAEDAQQLIVRGEQARVVGNQESAMPGRGRRRRGHRVQIGGGRAELRTGLEPGVRRLHEEIVQRLRSRARRIGKDRLGPERRRASGTRWVGKGQLRELRQTLDFGDQQILFRRRARQRKRVHAAALEGRRALDERAHVQRLALGLGLDQRRQQGAGFAHQLDHLGGGGQPMLDDSVEQGLDGIAQIPHPGRAHQSATALQGMEAAAQGGEGEIIRAVRLPAPQMIVDGAGLVPGLLEEHLDQLR